MADTTTVIKRPVEAPGLQWCTVHNSRRVDAEVDWPRCYSWDHDPECDDLTGRDHPEGENCSPCDLQPLFFYETVS